MDVTDMSEFFDIGDCSDSSLSSNMNDPEFFDVLNDISTTAQCIMDQDNQEIDSKMDNHLNSDLWLMSGVGEEHSPSHDSSSWSPKSNISSDKSYLSDNAVGTGSFGSALARWNDNGSESNVLINTKDRAEISKFNRLLDLSLKSTEHLTCIDNLQHLDQGSGDMMNAPRIVRPILLQRENQRASMRLDQNGRNSKFQTIAENNIGSMVTLPAMIQLDEKAGVQYSNTCQQMNQPIAAPVFYVVNSDANHPRTLNKYTSVQPSVITQAPSAIQRHRVLAHPYLRPDDRYSHNIRKPACVVPPTQHIVQQDPPRSVEENLTRTSLFHGEEAEERITQPHYVVEKVVKTPGFSEFSLTDEEYGVFISEGLPVPRCFPLSKTDERNLKKVRRKLKNKWSAQESRRKKKEYLESLEEQCESVSSENQQLKIRVNHLEHDNKTLVSQLRRLQELVSSFGTTTLKSSMSGVSGMLIRSPPEQPNMSSSSSPDANKANTGKSTVLMMFTIFLTSLLAGTAPYGSTNSNLFLDSSLHPVVFPDTQHSHVTHLHQDSSTSRNLRNTLLLLSPFAPSRVIYLNRAPFKPNQEEIKSRVLHYTPHEHEKSEPTAPSGHQLKVVSTKKAETHKIAKTTIPVTFSEVQKWNDFEFENESATQMPDMGFNWLIVATTSHPKFFSNSANYSATLPRVLVRESSKQGNHLENNHHFQAHGGEPHHNFTSQITA